MENLVKSELEKHMPTFQNEQDYAGRACVVYDNSRLLYFHRVYLWFVQTFQRHVLLPTLG